MNRAGPRHRAPLQAARLCDRRLRPAARSPRLPGAETFAGEQYHSSRHVSGERFAGKRALVIGSNSSAHDICVDLWESGAEVTMVQRSPTTVIRSETLMELAFGELYSEAALKNGITTDKADLLFASLPFRLMADRAAPALRGNRAPRCRFLRPSRQGRFPPRLRRRRLRPAHEGAPHRLGLLHRRRRLGADRERRGQAESGRRGEGGAPALGPSSPTAANSPPTSSSPRPAINR